MGALLGIGLFVALAYFAKHVSMDGRKGSWMVILVALITRLCFAILWEIELASDFLYYFNTATSFASVPLREWGTLAMSTYFTTDWPTLVPFVLFEALVMKVFGQYTLVFVLLNGLASTISCYFIYLIGKKLCGQRVGFLASMLYVFSPAVLTYIPVVSNQHIALTALLGALYLLMGVDDSAWIYRSMGAGVLLAFSQLIRAETTVVWMAIVATMIWLLIHRKQVPSFGKTMMRIAQAMVLTYIVYGLIMQMVDSLILNSGIVEVSIQNSNLAYKLMVGLNAESVGYWNEADALRFDLFPETMWEVIKERLQQPITTAILWIKKFFINLLWYGNTFAVPNVEPSSALYPFVTTGVIEISNGYMISVAVCGVYQMVQSLWHRTVCTFQQWLLFWICAGFMGAFVLMETQMRYQMVTYPALMLFASQTVMARLSHLHLGKENGKIEKS